MHLYSEVLMLNLHGHKLVHIYHPPMFAPSSDKLNLTQVENLRITELYEQLIEAHCEGCYVHLLFLLQFS